VKLKPAEIASFLKSPKESAPAALIYGPDEGLVRERLNILAKAVVPDLKDPFRVASLEPAEIRDDPARLADEAAALSMIGGKRVVLVSGATDAIAAAVSAFLENTDVVKGAPVSLVIISAGDLGPRSSLRRAFEDSGVAPAIPCYADDAGSLESIVLDELRAAGLAAEPDALDFLVGHLGGDRQVSRRELEKLVLYMGDAPRDDADKSGGAHRPVTLADVTACIGDVAALALDDVVRAVAEGDVAALDKDLARLFDEGEQPVMILRALARHFQRLHRASGLMAKGESPAQAIAALRPPVFFKERTSFERQLRQWTAVKLGAALERLTKAEVLCKTTGLPAEAICSRECMALAAAARAGR
jgi:DNA polymerase-3 subunit delta